MLKNEGPESAFAIAVITGGIREEALTQENVRFVRTEIPGGESKQVQEIISLYIFNFGFSRIATQIQGPADLPEVEFLVITDPEELRANCPLCLGTKKLLFTEWVKFICQ